MGKLALGGAVVASGKVNQKPVQLDLDPHDVIADEGHVVYALDRQPQSLPGRTDHQGFDFACRHPADGTGLPGDPKVSPASNDDNVLSWE